MMRGTQTARSGTPAFPVPGQKLKILRIQRCRVENWYLHPSHFAEKPSLLFIGRCIYLVEKPCKIGKFCSKAIFPAGPNGLDYYISESRQRNLSHIYYSVSSYQDRCDLCADGTTGVSGAHCRITLPINRTTQINRFENDLASFTKPKQSKKDQSGTPDGLMCAGIIHRPSRTCTNSCDTQDIRLSLTDDSYKGRKFTNQYFELLLAEENEKELYDKKEYFIMMIEQLRPDAPTLLEMLNRTRKKYQHLNRETETVKAKTLKNCMRDLGRILFMINISEDKIKVPPDSQKLIKWTFKVLNNYKNNHMTISSNKDAAITKLNGKYVNRVRPKSGSRNHRHVGEVHIQLESHNIYNQNGVTETDVEEELFGTYVTQREDGTAIMTTELCLEAVEKGVCVLRTGVSLFFAADNDFDNLSYFEKVSLQLNVY
ncbi:hypothetical protein GQR58_007438 [Nymphon striatum]|nr:hypothetical protein GQR58_007438 [Nymphon striatum]